MINDGCCGSCRTTARNDLGAFIWKCFVTILPSTAYKPNWHIDAIVYQLMRVVAGEVRRLLITQPPRTLKSICVSVALVAWLLGHDPSRRIVVVSYSNELAAELHRQFRMVVDSLWYQALFPGIRAARDTGTEFVTTAGGCRYATSVGGTLTGRGGDLVILDDPQKTEDAASEPARQRLIEWYTGTLVSRLNDKKNGAIIVVMQRQHEYDLLEEQSGWTHLNLPAIAGEDSIIPIGQGKPFVRRRGDILHPRLEDQATLDRIKDEMGSHTFSAQYLQQPAPPEGNLIKRHWFRTWDFVPEPGRIFQSWDIAMMTGPSNDFSVCTTWLMTQSDYYLLHVFRKRLEYSDLRRKIAMLADQQDADTILIENIGPGMALLQDLRRDLPPGMPFPRGQKPEGSKVDRMIAQSAKIEAGHVYLPSMTQWLDWLDIFVAELLAFPYGRYNDQVDSTSQFLNWASKRRFFEPTYQTGLPM